MINPNSHLANEFNPKSIKFNLKREKVIAGSCRIKLPKIQEITAQWKKVLEKQSNCQDYYPDWSGNWNLVAKSRLIESLILNIPVPPIVLFEINRDCYFLIDGSKRLQTIEDFYSDRFALTELEILTDLENLSYSALPLKDNQWLNQKSLTFTKCVSACKKTTEAEKLALASIMKQRYSVVDYSKSESNC